MITYLWIWTYRDTFFIFLFYEIMVEREGFAFDLEVFFEWLPDFYSHCKIIGHDVVDCRWLHPKKFLDKVDRGKKLEQVHKPTI